MSGSNSGSPYEETSTKRLRSLLRDPVVKRDSRKVAQITEELRFRHMRSKGRG